MMLAWGGLLNAEERGKLIDVAQAIGCDPSHLSACIAFESRWDSAAYNAASGASGLIQFMPGPRGSAVALGTTTDAIRRMSRVEQLELVRRYFAPYVGRVGRLSDLYMAILWPKAIGWDDAAALFSADDVMSKTYVQNKGLDLNRDGVITKAEATAFVARRLQEGLLPQNAADSETQPAAPIVDAGRPYNPEQEAPMPGIADTVAAAAPIVGTAIGGPVGGLVGSLAGAIVQMFSANAQKKIDAELARHGNSPDVVASINDTLSAGVMGLATQITGKTDPVEAYTAVVKDPAIVTQIEQATVAKLEEIAPFLDKIAGYEQQAFDRGEASMNAAVARQNSSPENRQLALLTGRITAWGLVGVTGVLLAMCVVQLWFAKTIDGTVATLAGGALAVLYQNAGQVFNFLFGQPQESRAASLAQAELDARRPRAQ